jgi:hypothetical protein
MLIRKKGLPFFLALFRTYPTFLGVGGWKVGLRFSHHLCSACPNLTLKMMPLGVRSSCQRRAVHMNMIGEVLSKNARGGFFIF